MYDVKTLTKEQALADLREEEEACWKMAAVFLRRRDPHGLHDIGVEIEGIRWGIHALERTA